MKNKDDIKNLWLGEHFRQFDPETREVIADRHWCILEQVGEDNDRGYATVIEKKYKGQRAIGNPIRRIDWGNEVEFVEVEVKE
jgi:hypothetical protein